MSPKTLYWVLLDRKERIHMRHSGCRNVGRQAIYRAAFRARLARRFTEYLTVASCANQTWLAEHFRIAICEVDGLIIAVDRIC